MRSIGEFSCRPSDEYLRNQEILVRTDRGIEWGEVLSEASEMTRKYLNSKKSAGRILRVPMNKTSNLAMNLITKNVQNSPVVAT